MRHSICSARWRTAAAPKLAALVLVAASMQLSACGRLGMYDLHAAPAYWVDNQESNAPHTGEFDFNAVDIGTDGSAWIAGDKFILRAAEEQLDMVFANLGSHRVQSLRAVAAAGDTVWVGGSRSWDHTNAVLWRRLPDGTWQPALEGLETADRTIYELDFDSHGRGVAVLFHHSSRQSEVALFDGSRWQRVASPPEPNNGTHVCQGADGVPLLGLAPSPAPAVYRWQNGSWLAEPLPFRDAEIEGELVLPRLVCFRDGSALTALGLRRSKDSDPERWWLFRRSIAGWQEVAFPTEFHRGGAFVIGGVSSSDFWISGNCAGCDPALLHYTQEQWHRVEPPALPGGRRRGYLIKEMAFSSADEGWAVGDEVVGANLNRGVIFHYHQGQWRYRPWYWRFWNQPMWGFLGD